MTLLITGAGFSKCWGHPLTSQVLEFALRFLKEDTEGDDNETNAHHVIAFLEELQRSSRPLFEDFERLLTMLKEAGDDWNSDVWGRMGIDKRVLFVPDPEYYFNQLQWALAVALNWSGWGAPPDGWPRLSAGVPKGYAKFIEDFGPFDVVITVNYDNIPEYLFRERAIDYGIPDERALDVTEFRAVGNAGLGQPIYKVETEPHRTREGPVKVLKIHGLLNAAYCPTCKRAILFPNRLDGYEPAEPLAWLRTTAYDCTLHCGPLNKFSPPASPGRLRPLMIPPLADKKDLPEWEILGPIVEAAKTAASTAESAVIVGTALRESDTVLLDIVSRLAGKPVVLIGNAETAKRLADIVGPDNVTVPRRYLEERPEDCKELVRTTRGVDWKAIPHEEFAAVAAAPTPSRNPPFVTAPQWGQLPEFDREGTFYVRRVGNVLAHPQDVPHLKVPHVGPPFGDNDAFLPTITIEGEGGEEMFRLPLYLNSWALDREANALMGHRDIPARVRFRKREGKLVPLILGP